MSIITTPMLKSYFSISILIGIITCIYFLLRRHGIHILLKKSTNWFEAVENGDQQFLKKHLDKRCKTKNEDGETALMICAHKGYIDCVQLLQGEIKMTDNKGWTALMHAAQNNCSECVKLLLQEMKMTSNEMKTALMISAENGCIGCAQLLLCEMMKADQYGWTALMYAADKNHPECVKLLLPEIRMADNLKKTALHIVCHWGHTECAKLLLEEADFVDKDGKTPLDIANKEFQYSNQDKYLHCVKLIDDYLQNIQMQRTQVWFEAAEKGDYEFLKGNLDKGIKTQNQKGETALMRCAVQGFVNCVQLLLSEMRMIDKGGWTALMGAAHNNNVECVVLLLSEMCMADKWKCTALMYAAESGNTRCVKLLLNELRMVDDEMKTALHKACFNGYPECVELLLKEAEFVNEDGETPLDVAKSLSCENQDEKYSKCANLIEDYLRNKQTEVKHPKIGTRFEQTTHRTNVLSKETTHSFQKAQVQTCSPPTIEKFQKIEQMQTQLIMIQQTIKTIKYPKIEAQCEQTKRFDQNDQPQNLVIQTTQQAIGKMGSQDLQIIEQQWANEHSTIHKLLPQDTIKGSNGAYTSFIKLGKAKNSFAYTAVRQDRKEVVMKVTELIEGMYKYIKREASIQDIQHPNIIRIHDAFLVNRDQETFGVIVMDKAFLFAQAFPNGMNQAQLRGIVVDIASALSYIHSLNPQIIHRDVKPDNIMIMQQGKRRAVLIDFNACIITEDRTADTDIECQQFQAPEINGNKYDDRVDAFSLGKTIQVWMNQFKVVDDELLQLSTRMCGNDPNERPKLDNIVLFLKGDIKFDEIEFDERK